MYPKRKEKVVSIDDAVALIKPGSLVAIGGFMIHNHPMALIREIVRRKINNLKIIPTPPGGGIDADMLIGSGVATTIYSSYAGAEWLAPVMPNYQRKIQSGEIENLEFDENTIICGYRAAIQKLPCEITRGGLGSDMLKVNPCLKVFKDPITESPLVAVPPIEPDVAIIHAQRSDPYGNIQHAGSVFMDALIASAAKKVVVSVEEVIPHEFITRDPFKTTIPCTLVDAVIRIPYGAHPCSSHAYYTHDEDHIRQYIKNCKVLEDYKVYLDRYVYGTKDNEEYLESVGGVRKIFELKLY